MFKITNSGRFQICYARKIIITWDTVQNKIIFLVLCTHFNFFGFISLVFIMLGNRLKFLRSSDLELKKSVNFVRFNRRLWLVLINGDFISFRNLVVSTRLQNGDFGLDLKTVLLFCKFNEYESWVTYQTSVEISTYALYFRAISTYFNLSTLQFWLFLNYFNVLFLFLLFIKTHETEKKELSKL